MFPVLAKQQNSLDWMKGIRIKPKRRRTRSVGFRRGNARIIVVCADSIPSRTASEIDREHHRAT